MKPKRLENTLTVLKIHPFFFWKYTLYLYSSVNRSANIKAAAYNRKTTALNVVLYSSVTVWGDMPYLVVSCEQTYCDAGFVFCADFSQFDEFVLQQSQLGRGRCAMITGDNWGYIQIIISHVTTWHVIIQLGDYLERTLIIAGQLTTWDMSSLFGMLWSLSRSWVNLGDVLIITGQATTWDKSWSSQAKWQLWTCPDHRRLSVNLGHVLIIG